MKHYQVTLTTANTIYNLKALILAIDSRFRDNYQQLIIQSDDGNSVAVHLGNAAVTTANYGIKLVAANDSVNINTGVVAGIYATSGTNAQLLDLSFF